VCAAPIWSMFAEFTATGTVLLHFSDIPLRRPQAGRLRHPISSVVKPSGKRMLLWMRKLLIIMAVSDIARPEKPAAFHQQHRLSGMPSQIFGSLRGYFANHVNELCFDCRTRLEHNVLRLLDCKQPGCQQVANQAPKSLDYLCLACADHFQQLKNYLGILEIPFEVNQRLVRGLDYYTRTVFEIQPEEEKAPKHNCRRRSLRRTD